MDQNESLIYKADREFFLNTLLIIPISTLMLFSTPKPNLEIVAYVVWSVKWRKGVQFPNY